MKSNKKKELAKLLFVRENLTQKEIAERVGTSEQTICRWVAENDNEWKKLRQSIIITKEEQLRRLYEQMDELNQEISRRDPGKRYANTKEADTLVKLTAAANNLESDASIADIIEVSKRFLNFMRPVNLDKAREMSGYLDAFIKDQLRK